MSLLDVSVFWYHSGFSQDLKKLPLCSPFKGKICLTVTSFLWRKSCCLLPILTCLQNSVKVLVLKELLPDIIFLSNKKDEVDYLLHCVLHHWPFAFHEGKKKSSSILSNKCMLQISVQKCLFDVFLTGDCAFTS